MTDVKLNEITPETLESAQTYDEYREMIDNLLSQNKTTGENHSEVMIHYTKMNAHRMERHDKRSELLPELAERLNKVERPMIWLVLTEAWCGDAAQLVPIINKMAEASPNIELKLILRDDNLEVMDQFLTNGRSRSIPKLICLDAESLEVIGDWGARPGKAQLLYDSLKGSGDIAYQEVAEYLHKWYADDKGEEIQKEFLPLIEEWDSK